MNCSTTTSSITAVYSNLIGGSSIAITGLESYHPYYIMTLTLFVLKMILGFISIAILIWA